MNKLKLRRSEGAGNQIAMRGGAYSLTISAVVLAILIVVNIFASALPAALTKYDIAELQLPDHQRFRRVPAENRDDRRFPLAYLGIGIYVVLRRRRLQNEPV